MTLLRAPEPLDIANHIPTQWQSWLKSARLWTGLTRVKLAKLAGVSDCTIKQAETGRHLGNTPRTKVKLVRAIDEYERDRTAAPPPPDPVFHFGW